MDYDSCRWSLGIDTCLLVIFPVLLLTISIAISCSALLVSDSVSLLSRMKDDEPRRTITLAFLQLHAERPAPVAPTQIRLRIQFREIPCPTISLLCLVRAL